MGSENTSSVAPVQSIVHTPGPWFAHMNGEGAFCIKTGRDYDTSPTLASRNKWKSNADASNANARLIAAAPDLLEALEESLALNVNWSETAEDEHLRHLSEYTRVIEQARAVIEKATKVV